MASSAHHGTTAPFIRKPGHWLGATCLAALLLAHGASAQALGDIRQQLEQSHGFDITPQPLATALIDFARQSGIQVSVDSALIANLASPGSHGQHSAREALEQLLQGSGMRWRQNTSDSLTLEPDPLASKVEASDGIPLQTPDIFVIAKPPHDYQGEANIDRRAIENFAGANGDLTTLLKLHPSVRFDTAQKSSKTPGEISPADISINGARFYQNNFMIDGISINNDLNPAASSGSRMDVNGIYDVPSNAFGIAIDADLLEEVRVYDSNVPAEYGRFNGGVIDAITRRPREGFHGKISASMTRSEWTEYHLSDDDISEEEFELSSDYTHQPEFKKLSTRVMLEGMVTENFGLIGNFVRKTSEIPLYTYADGYQSAGDQVKRDQTREIDNYMLKGFWTPNERLDLTFTLVDAPAEAEFFKANQKDSGFTIHSGGQSAALQAIWNGDQVTQTHKLSWKSVQSSRDADSNVLKSWRWSEEKNWGNPARGVNSTSIEGGMGDLEQTQRGFEYAFKAELQPLIFLGSSHKLSGGLDLSRQEARYEVTEDSWTATTPRLANATGSSTCVTASGLLDDEYCSISINAAGVAQRQYFGFLNYYKAGVIELDQTSYALWLQDEIQIGRLNLRPGLRLDGDDYMDKKTLAPRLAASYDLLGDGRTVFSAGANRYYGRNLFRYRLADGRESLRWRASRLASSTDTITDFGALINYGVDESSFRKLDIPYDDEWTVGLSQQMLGMRFDLKYVHRDGHDQIVRARSRDLGLPDGDGTTTIANYYTYTNAARSENETVTLSITPLQNLRLAGTVTSLQAAFDWNQTKSSYYDDYNTVFNSSRLDDEDVYFDGKLVPYSELPASNFNRPWTARLNTVTSIPALNLTWSNFFHYRGSYEQIYSDGTITVDGSSYAHYSVGEAKAALTWDTRVKLDIPLHGEQALYMAVDVTNVTNHVNEIVGSGGSLSYETGRQYWLEVGYQF